MLFIAALIMNANTNFEEKNYLSVIQNFVDKHVIPYDTLLDKEKIAHIERIAQLCRAKKVKLKSLTDLVAQRGVAKPEESLEIDKLQSYIHNFENKEERYFNAFNMIANVLKSNTAKPYFSMSEFRDLVFKNRKVVQEGEKYFDEWFNYTLKRYNDYQKTSVQDDSILIMGNPALDVCCFRSVMNEEIRLSELICTPNKFNFNQTYSNRHTIEHSFKLRPTMTDEQKRAVFACVGTPHYLSLMEGWAGAGKSYSSDCIKEIYMAAGFDCIGVALSYMAVDVLKNETGMECVVISSLKNRILRSGGKSIFNKPTLLVIDEAGLVGTKDLKLILEHAHASPFPVKVVLSGDATQLLPINDTGVLEYVKRLLPDDAKCTIETIFRQNCESHRQSVKMMQAGYSGMAFYIYWQQQMLKFCENKNALLEKITHDYLASVKANPEDSRLIIGLKKETIDALNFQIREQLKNMGKIDTSKGDVHFQVFRNNGSKVILPFAVGEKVVFLKNDNKIKLCHIGTADSDNPVYYNNSIKNRMFGRIVEIKKKGKDGEELGYDFKIHVDFEDEDKKQSAEVIINSKDYLKEVKNRKDKGLGTPALALDHAYAVTNYSSQGQTVNHLFCIDGVEMHNRYAYVSASRHKDAMTIYFDKQDLFQRMVAAKKYQSTTEASSYASVIDLLNFIGEQWNKVDEAPTLFTHYGNVWTRLSLAKSHLVASRKISPDFDLLEQGEDASVIKLYGVLKGAEEIQRKRKGELTIPPTQWEGKHFHILDSPSYYRPNDKSLDLKSLNQENQTENTFSIDSDLNDLSHVKTLEKRSYNLSHILDKDKFLRMWGKYFDIARGGELCFISRIGENVVSKYNLFGEDLLGVGYPFVVHGESQANGTYQENVIILQDINYLLEFMDYYYFNPKKGIEPPILIWGAKDCDYSYIISMLDNKTLTFFGDDEFKAKSFYSLFNRNQDINIKIKLSDFDQTILKEYGIPQPANMEKISFIYSYVSDHYRNTDAPIPYKVNEQEAHSFVNDKGMLNKDFMKDILISHNILSQAAWDKHVEPYYQKLENHSVLPEPESLTVSPKKLKV